MKFKNVHKSSIKLAKGTFVEKGGTVSLSDLKEYLSPQQVAWYTSKESGILEAVEEKEETPEPKAKKPAAKRTRSTRKKPTKSSEE